MRTARPTSQIALQQTVLADYRLPFINELAGQLRGTLRIYAGRDYFDPSIKTRTKHVNAVTLVGNRYLFRRRLQWQRKLIRPLTYADVTVLEFNPRILSNWAILLIRRAHGRRTVLWGHAWSRRGPSSWTGSLRKLMRRFATVLVVYTETEKRMLDAQGGWGSVIAAPNALYPREDITPAQSAEPPKDFLFVGRLVPAKKPLLLVRAFLWAADHGLAPHHQLLIAGDGPLRDEVADACSSHPCGRRVSLLGHVDPNETRHLYGRAVASVSPGYVGLSLTQSLSYGVPMIYAENEPHAPEREAAKDGWNAIPVASGSVFALGQALIAVANESHRWIQQRDMIARDCRTRYTVETMAKRMIGAIAADHGAQE